MPRISNEAIAGAAIIGGLADRNNQEDIAFWVALALAESSGITDRVSWTGCCKCLWQVNVGVWAGDIPNAPSDPAQFRRWLEQPLNCARASAHIKAAQGLRAWEAYTNGSYRQYLDEGRRAARNPDVTTPAQMAGNDASFTDPNAWAAAAGSLIPDIDPLDGIRDAFQAVIEALNRIGSWIADRDNWIRVAEVVGGTALAVGAGLILVKPYLLEAKKAVTP